MTGDGERVRLFPTCSGIYDLGAVSHSSCPHTEFHNLFEGKVDEEEHLVSDYACAWVKDVGISTV